MSEPRAQPNPAQRPPEPPAYDHGSRFPVDPDGWQIVDLGRSMFPGGPRACRAMSPMGTFYFGLNLQPRDDGLLTATVTNLGWPRINSPLPNVFMSGEAVVEAQTRVRAYILAHWRAFRSRRAVEVVFAPGDGRVVDIF